ncbi:hypothetical protein [Mycolicibacterium peregrinum]|uniref:Uncharacterized protein n=1 Tax=Mycolicibacterium peregrinum TaxID=43304 RepID=A0A1A0V7S8_MYCPR|nr:hypothetical protein [Mycolicibacterium peregrinum]OBB79288.1 hypothetical protein A5779_12910 [Mycolicibacterium peregrinum]
MDLGAGRYELQEKYYSDAAKDMVNDLAGDPSLQKESVKDEHGNIVIRGTDDMGWGEMVDYNVNRLTYPGWSAESFEAGQAADPGELELDPGQRGTGRQECGDPR